MRAGFWAIALFGLAACSGGDPVVRPSESGGNRADGIVTMSSTTSLYSSAGPDWSVGQAGAAKRCRSWGHDAAPTFSGWREKCTAWDRYGRCLTTLHTRYYDCKD